MRIALQTDAQIVGVGLGGGSEGNLDFELAALHVVAQFQAGHD